MISGLLFISLKFRFSYKTAARVMALIAAGSELCKIFTHIEEAEGGGVLGPGYLPLHLCSILIFLIFYCALSDNQQRIAKITSFCLLIGIWGGLLAILMATISPNSMPISASCTMQACCGGRCICCVPNRWSWGKGLHKEFGCFGKPAVCDAVGQ